MKAVFLNGPPGSGKDTAANALMASAIWNAHFKGVKFKPYHMKLATPLKAAAHCLFGLPSDIPTEYFDDCKNIPSPDFFDETPRSVYIALSERFMKPEYGKASFGRIFTRRIKAATSMGLSTDEPFIICSDLGFDEELDAVLSEVIGRENALIIQVSRYGTGFKEGKDSRSYIEADDIATIGIHNDHQPAFERAVTTAVVDWLACV